MSTMYLEETDSNRSRTNFILSDLSNEEGILRQSVDISKIAEYIADEHSNIAEECVHQYAITKKFTGSDDITIMLSPENTIKFLESLSSYYYENNLSGALSVDE